MCVCVCVREREREGGGGGRVSVYLYAALILMFPIDVQRKPKQKTKTKTNTKTKSKHTKKKENGQMYLYGARGRNSSLVVFGLAVHRVAGSILLWGNFPVEGIFPLELTWVQTPFPPKTLSKPRSSLCTHAFPRTDSKDPDVHVLDG